MSRPISRRAWLLAEGNIFPGGATIVSVRRDPVSYEVSVSTTGGGRWTVPGHIHVQVLTRSGAIRALQRRLGRRDC